MDARSLVAPLHDPKRRIGWLACVVFLVRSTCGAADAPTLSPATSQDRAEYLRRAQVWKETDVASKNLYDGPRSDLNFAVDQEVTCEFYPKPIGGLTEKFFCRLDDGRVFKVKYNDGPRFKEAVSEILGTRLFWALGFYADTMMPVRVTCRDCPKHPWKYVRARKHRHDLDENGMIRALPPEAEVGTYTFYPAAIEERLDVVPIEHKKDQGWSWKSLNTVDPKAGGATRAEIDALKLLNAFVQNSDNKAKQNALACPREAVEESDGGRTTCRRPILYVDDLGDVFGKGGFITGYDGRVDYEGWKHVPVWRNTDTCTARLKSIGGIFRPGTLSNPRIGEEGRALLAAQLAQLSDTQIADLFRASRIESLHETISDGGSGSREVTIEDWVALFKAKRDEITLHAPCKEAR